jgi:hypothetical protein
MDGIQWIDGGGGKQVLLVDLSYSTLERAQALITQAGTIIRSAPPDSVLILADFTGVEFNSDLVALVKQVATVDRPHVKRSAWVGSESLSQVWLSAIERVSQRTFHRFDTREEALSFLVEE